MEGLVPRLERNSFRVSAQKLLIECLSLYTHAKKWERKAEIGTQKIYSAVVGLPKICCKIFKVMR